MSKLKVVNKSYAGEPEHICFQNVDTLELIEFSKVTNESINDGDFQHPIVQQVMNSSADHTVEYSVDENGNITLIF
jgi:hypothetical protein